MAPSIEDFGGKVTTASLLEFIDNGGTLMITTDTTVGLGQNSILHLSLSNGKIATNRSFST